MIKGEKNFILEKMKNFTFKVPVGGFFQVHPPLAVNLFEKVQELLSIDENTIILDICAGTGTFGIMLG